MLQEVHFTETNQSRWEREWGNIAFFSGGYSNKEGVGILLNQRCTYKINDYTEVISGRLQILKITISEHDYTIINLYGPNNDNITLYEKFEEYIKVHEGDNFIGILKTQIPILR